MEFATGALGTLLPKLGQLLQDEYNLQKSAKKNIEFLTSELGSIQAALRSVGEAPPAQLNEQVRIWAHDAREVSYDMEDIVDAFLVRVQSPDAPSKKSSKRFIKKMMDFVTKAKTRHEIGQEIRDIKERVKEVAERRDRYKFDAITPTNTLVDPRIASLYTKVADLVGVDGSVEELITKLTKGDDMPAQQMILSVVGFGGLGKTTLAKAVYDKLKVKGQFDCMAFVTVGRNPSLKSVFLDILINLDKEYMNSMFTALSETQLINELRDFLENKRYFIVIDDIWDIKSWKIIKLAFDENNSGSRIITTTRSHEVAKEAGVPYELQPLSKDNSRKLFFARINGDIRSSFSNHQPDDEVSDKILKKCEGVPLAIITMASLLVGKPSAVWSEVHRSIGFGNGQNDQVENTKRIISFSYYDLPPHLRTCLLYLSVFPEDYFIEKDQLILIWMAEGFVCEELGISSFKIGEGYFNELVNRSMIQMVEAEWEGEWHGTVYGCRIHDMVLDLICSISSEENFVTILNHNEGASSSTTQDKVRRLALQSNRALEAHMDIKQVRSLLSFGCEIGKGVPFSSFKLVRVLNIDGYCKFTERHHVEHIWNLLHLRYLRVNLLGVESLGDIGTLKFLQTLDIVVGVGLRKLLTSVGHLTQLVCLRLRTQVETVPDGIGKLTSLEELEINYYSSEFGEEPLLRRFVKELGSLRELRVLRVSMYTAPGVRAVEMDMVESLRNLKKMEHLHLDLWWGAASADTATWEAAGFLLPLPLRRLSLHGIRFSRFPSFCINPSRLSILSHLWLEVDAIEEQDLRILGALPELRSLVLDVQSTTELVCNTSTTDAAGGDGYLFQKLRRCSMSYRDVRLLPSNKEDSGGVSFCMRHVNASMVFGSDVSSGKGVAPTLMPIAQELEFELSVREFKDGCSNFALEYFASLLKVRVEVDCRDASAAEVEETEATLRRAAGVHPNSPTLEIERMYEDKMISAAQDQEAGTSKGN